MSKVQSEGKNLIVNTVLIAVGNMGAKVVSFLLLPLYTSLLTTEQYGDYDYVITIAAFLLPVVTLCLYEAMFRYLIDAKSVEDKKKIISFSFITILIISLILISVFIFIIIFTEIKYSVYLLIYTLASVAYTFFTSALRGMGNTKKYALFSSIKNIMQVVLNVLAILVLRMGVEGLLLSTIISEFFGVFLCILGGKIWRYITFKNIHFSEYKSMVKYSIPLIPNNLSATIINLSDRIMITNMIGSDSNGIYAISYKFPNIFETVYHYFYTAWSESSARMLKNEKESDEIVYNSLRRTINNFIFGLIIIAVAGMAILFRIFVKGDYIAGFTCVPILMFSIYFNCLAKYYTGLFTAYKKTFIILISTLIAAIVNVTLNIFFLKQLGIIWAATTTLIANFLMCLIRFMAIQKYVRIKFDWKFWISAIPVTVAIVLLYDYDSWLKISIGLIIAILYSFIINLPTIKTLFISLKKRKNNKV